MKTDEQTDPASPQATAPASTELPPTAPCTVVWCGGRPYVLESSAGHNRWVGTDHRGRPVALTSADLQRRGWTHTRVSFSAGGLGCAEAGR
ncbi:hypothetical protein [Amycolatopsis sp. lyj-108]|uniref:hypothetical protein n=1 Tax=Amycolatopsis sp. lyj-108 TaxID=2789286 RepID=UPI003979BBA5